MSAWFLLVPVGVLLGFLAFLAAFALFLGDCIAALFLGGGLNRLRARSAAAALLFALIVPWTDESRAQNADSFAMQAALPGLSQARLIALLIRRAELPRRSIERDADRAALRASTEQLAALSVDLQQFLRALRRGSAEGVARYAERLQAVDVDLLAHISCASAFLADAHRGSSP